MLQRKSRFVESKFTLKHFVQKLIFAGNNESYKEALDYLQRAISIDQTDVTVYFKFAYFAAKSEKFHLARSALEESLYNQQHNSEDKLLINDQSGGK